MVEVLKLLGNNLSGDKVGFLCCAVRKGTFAMYIVSLEAIANLVMCVGKDAVLKLRLNILKRDAGAQGRPELWVGLCYGASNCKDDRSGGVALCFHKFEADQ